MATVGLILLVAVVLILAVVGYVLDRATKNDIRAEDPMGQYDPKELPKRGYLKTKANNLAVFLGL